MDAFTPRTAGQWQQAIDRQFKGERLVFVSRQAITSGLWADVRVETIVDGKHITKIVRLYF